MKWEMKLYPTWKQDPFALFSAHTLFPGILEQKWIAKPEGKARSKEKQFYLGISFTNII